MPDLVFLEELVRQLEIYAVRTGYIGVFFLSLIGSIVPFLPLPYLFLVVVLSAKLDPLLLGLLAGLGGSLGKMSSYALGRFGYRLLGETRKKKMSALRRLINRFGAVGIFVFALTPLPDDVLYIPIGITGYSFRRFMIASMAGKVILAIGVAYLGRAYLHFFHAFEVGDVVGTLVSIGVLVVITALILRTDWELLASHFERGGVKSVLMNLQEILVLKKNKNAASAG